MTLDRCNHCTLAGKKCHPQQGNGKIMFIGEAPGEQEINLNKPFTGTSGIFLRDTLAYLGLDMDNYYVTNTLKCRPSNNKLIWPDAHEQIAACRNWLRMELTTLLPNVIICVGSVALQGLTNANFYSTYGKLIAYKIGIHTSMVGVIRHPSYAIRCQWTIEQYAEHIKPYVKAIIQWQ